MNYPLSSFIVIDVNIDTGHRSNRSKSTQLMSIGAYNNIYNKDESNTWNKSSKWKYIDNSSFQKSKKIIKKRYVANMINGCLNHLTLDVKTPKIHHWCSLVSIITFITIRDEYIRKCCSYNTETRIESFVSLVKLNTNQCSHCTKHIIIIRVNIMLLSLIFRFFSFKFISQIFFKLR